MAEFGILALHPGVAGADRPHVFGYVTPRTNPSSPVFQVWNGPTDAAVVLSLDKDGVLQVIGELRAPSLNVQAAAVQAATMEGAGGDRITFIVTGSTHRGRIRYDGDGMFLSANARFVSGAGWLRDDPARPSFTMVLGHMGTDRLELRTTPAGEGNITWIEAVYLHPDGHCQFNRPVTIQPNTATAPFTLGANAQGQLVGGLNADLLDGQHASAFVPTSRAVNTGTGLAGGGNLSADRTLSIDTALVPRKDTAETITGLWTFSDVLSVARIPATKLELTRPGTAAKGRIGYDNNGLWLQTNAYFDGSWQRDDPAEPSFAIAVGHLGNDRMEFRVNPAGTGSIPWTVALTIGTDGVAEFATTPRVGANAVWHAGNDGPGSGLNADLLDGQHASAFVPTSRAINTGTGLAGGGNLSADRTLSVKPADFVTVSTSAPSGTPAAGVGALWAQVS